MFIKLSIALMMVVLVSCHSGIRQRIIASSAVRLDPSNFNFTACLIIKSPDLGEATGYCSAQIISNKSVITAAHCCNLTNPVFIIHTGAPSCNSTVGQNITTTNATFPKAPDTEVYTSNTTRHFNDICVVRTLGEDTIDIGPEYGTATIPICAVNSSLNPANRPAAISGYGVNELTGNFGARGAANTNIRNFNNCQQAWTILTLGIFQLEEGYNACTKSPPSICNGDSGGPVALSYSNNGVLEYCTTGINSIAVGFSITGVVTISSGYLLCPVINTCERLDTQDKHDFIQKCDPDAVINQ